MEAVAGAVLGPRPGKAICSFWQGGLEIALRIIAPLLGSLPSLITAAIALGEAEGSGGSQNVSAASGYVIAITSLAIILEILIIILRFCNIGLINIKIKIFLVIFIIISIFLLLGHVAGCVVSAIYGNDFFLGDDADALGFDFGSGMSGNGTTPSASSIQRIGDSLISSSFFCFLGAVLYGFLAVWEVIYMVKEWNDKVVKYTLKEAITG